VRHSKGGGKKKKEKRPQVTSDSESLKMLLRDQIATTRTRGKEGKESRVGCLKKVGSSKSEERKKGTISGRSCCKISFVAGGEREKEKERTPMTPNEVCKGIRLPLAEKKEGPLNVTLVGERKKKGTQNSMTPKHGKRFFRDIPRRKI